MRLLRICIFCALAPTIIPVGAQQSPCAKSATPSDFSGASSNSSPAPAGILQPGDSLEVEVLRMEKVRFPEEARERGIQGQVSLRVNISETGDVEKVEAISGDPVLIPSALAAVKKWKYRPFIRNGKAVKVSSVLPVDFAFSENVKEIMLDASAAAASVTFSSGAVTIPAALMTSRLVHKVAPVYPTLARANHIEGTVVLRATIRKNGRVDELAVVSGPRELVSSSIGAVEQWRYRPYIQNGQPVDVTTEICVEYRLTR